MLLARKFRRVVLKVTELDAQLNEWFEKVKKLVPTTAERAEMTAVGAEVLKNNLISETRQKHYRNTKHRKTKHLADSIASENKDFDGIVDGNSVVGFEKKSISGVNHARIARFLNDGTKKLVGDHFYTDTVKESEKAVFMAEKAVYDKHKHDL